MAVSHSGEAGRIAIGFSEKGFKLTRQPGWEPGSWGYHGDDGRKYHASGKGEEYGPTFGQGDVIGACIHWGRQEMFFTKNGARLALAFKGVRGVLYPTIGLHSRGETVELNFGRSPFKYDVQGLIMEEQAAQALAASKVPLPPTVTAALVKQYLCHHAYAQTLKALQAATRCAGLDNPVCSGEEEEEMEEGASHEASGPPAAGGQATAATAGKGARLSSQPKPSQQAVTLEGGGPQEGMSVDLQPFLTEVSAGHPSGKLPSSSTPPSMSQSQSQQGQGNQQQPLQHEQHQSFGSEKGACLNLRHRVRSLLVEGQVDAAVACIQGSAPQVLQPGCGFEETQIHLHCQKYIELIRCGDVTACVAYAQSHLAPMRGRLGPLWDAALREVVALLAYQDPLASPLSHLLSSAQREQTADAVNTALLAATAGKGGDHRPVSTLQSVLQHTLVLQATLTELAGGQGELMGVQALLSPPTTQGPHPMAL